MANAWNNGPGRCPGRFCRIGGDDKSTQERYFMKKLSTVAALAIASLVATTVYAADQKGMSGMEGQKGMSGMQGMEGKKK
jgi:hypothetical protein